MINQQPNQKVLSFNYVLKNPQGTTLDSSEGQPIVFLTGALQILPALEKELLNMLIGQKKTVHLSAQDAYGEHDPNLVIQVPKEDLSHIEIEVGTLLQVNSDAGTRVVKVVELTEEMVTLDGNHPLAGQDLVFEVELTDSRAATPEEIAHGHAHGPGGHTH